MFSRPYPANVSLCSLVSTSHHRCLVIGPDKAPELLATAGYPRDRPDDRPVHQIGPPFLIESIEGGCQYDLGTSETLKETEGLKAPSLSTDANSERWSALTSAFPSNSPVLAPLLGTPGAVQ